MYMDVLLPFVQMLEKEAEAQKLEKAFLCPTENAKRNKYRKSTKDQFRFEGRSADGAEGITAEQVSQTFSVTGENPQ